MIDRTVPNTLLKSIIRHLTSLLFSSLLVTLCIMEVIQTQQWSHITAAKAYSYTSVGWPCKANCRADNPLHAVRQASWGKKEMEFACTQMLTLFLIILLEDRLRSNIGYTLRGDLAVFTCLARTPPKVNRFGWNWEPSEYIVGGWPLRILCAIRAVVCDSLRVGEFFPVR